MDYPINTRIAELAAKSASTIGRALAAGDVSAVDLTSYLLDQIEISETKSVFIKVTKKRALAEASAAVKRLKSGQPLSALDGVPLVWKDLFDFAGETTTAASKTYQKADVRRRDAETVANVAASGMIMLGKVNLSEFAFSGLGLNPHFGTPPNPFSKDIKRAPGGSSSGTAVAVAMGFAPCGIGTDTGGSIRIPAAFNALVGFKPSEGRISKEGVFPLSRTLDTVGPIARSVEDCIQLDAALSGKVMSAVRRRSISGVHVFVPEAVVLEDLDAAVEANFMQSVTALEKAGARISRGPDKLFRKVADLIAMHGSITSADAYAEHQAIVESPGAKEVDPRVLDRILAGRSVLAVDLIILQRERERLQEELKTYLNGGLIAMPTTAMTAPALAKLEIDTKHFHQVNQKVLRNTSIGNYLNMPGLALPNGFDPSGLPTSILFSGSPGSDDALLGYGLELERIVR